MSSRNHINDSRDRTRNEREYIVRYVYEIPGARKTWDFRTRDKAQAFRKAQKYATHGLLIGLYRHNGVGRWEALTVPGVAQ